MTRSVRIALLFSGGKDSVMVLNLARMNGHEVTTLVSMIPKRDDSYMFHVPNIRHTDTIAKAIGIPVITKETAGEKEKELDDLRDVLAGLDIDAVGAGAVASSYQNERVGAIARELGLKVYAPLWQVGQDEVLRSEVDAGLEIIITGVFAEGLGNEWLGRRIDSAAICELEKLVAKYGINITGEGGEYETIVLDAPFFKGRLEIVKSKKVINSNSGTLEIEEIKIIDK